MNRRDFITLLGGAAATWPVTARAQQATVPVVGFLRSTSPADSTSFVTAFRQGLQERGFLENQNVAIEFRFAQGQVDRLPALVSELIERKVAVIVANGAATPVAKAATTTIPIVFAGGADPVRDGFVASLNRPGGNVTGVLFFSSMLGAKRLELLRRLAPKASTIAVLVHPSIPETEAERKEIEAAAQVMGQQLIILDIQSDRDIDSAFTTLVQLGAGALLIGSGAFMSSKLERLAALTAQYAVPASYSLRQFAVLGGLMSYGTNQQDAYRQAGIYTGRILKGERPADLPVMQPVKFDFVLNLKTARSLGLEVPDQLLALADEVIE